VQEPLSLQFIADSTLGKLAKYLRLAGFDTLLDARSPDADRLNMLAGPHRIILTRSVQVKKLIGDAQVIFIRANDPSDQMLQVFTDLHLQFKDLHPLTRCAVCNRLLTALPKDKAQGRVPDYTWQQHCLFKECPECKRIYWQGTHAKRWMVRVREKISH
jgi:uncharacterized protein with PIN domain